MKVSFKNYIQQARLLFEPPPYPPQTHKYNFKAGELLQMYKPTSNQLCWMKLDCICSILLTWNNIDLRTNIINEMYHWRTMHIL